jgi:hypothetical protein
VNRIWKSVIFMLATIYFLVDAVFMTVARPFGNRIAAHRIFGSLRIRIVSLRPYPTLALFAVPLIVLEPVKPVAAYLARSNCFRFSVRAAVRLPYSRYAGRSLKTCGSTASIASRSCWARILKQTRRFQRAPRIGGRRRRRAIAREPRYLGVARRMTPASFGDAKRFTKTS